MSIVASDIKFLGAANHQTTDVGAQGGAIDTGTKITFTEISANDNIEIVSSNAGDTTQTFTVFGRLASGVLTSENIAVNGTTQAVSVNAYTRIERMTLDAPTAGTLTIRKASDNVTIATMEAGIDMVTKPFYNVSSDVSGGATRTYYEKLFIKNDHATLSLLNAAVVEFSDGTEAGGADVTFDLEDAVDDNNTSANRVSAPTGMLGTFTDASKNVPGTNLAAGSAIGVWLKLTLPAGTASTDTTFALNVSGSSM
jgi:hypothetical protein